MNTYNPAVQLPRAFALTTLLLICLLLGSCDPRKGGRSGGGAGQPGEYPAAALEYLGDALEHPTEDYPALGYSWSIVAQLTKLADAKSAARIRELIAGNVQQAKPQLPPELLAAWLSTDREAATKYMHEQLKLGTWQYMQSLWFHPELARETYADPLTRLVEPKLLREEAVAQWLGLMNYWAFVLPEDDNLLTSFVNRDGEPDNTLRAAGWILRYDEGDQLLLDYFDKALTEAGTDNLKLLSGASEGIKIAREPKLADLLVPLVANVQLGEPPAAEDIATDEDVAERITETPSSHLYASYALAHLPGEQAALMRKRLLDATDGTIAWQARLGQLLYGGDPGPWNAAVAEAAIDERNMWLALDPAHVAHPSLLPTLRRAASAPQTPLRLRAATQLNRYWPYRQRADVVELVRQLQSDDEEAVREAAWYTAGKLALVELDPVSVINDRQETPAVRLAAAYAALMVAQGGPPEASWPNNMLLAEANAEMEVPDPNFPPLPASENTETPAQAESPEAAEPEAK